MTPSYAYEGPILGEDDRWRRDFLVVLPPWMYDEAARQLGAAHVARHYVRQAPMPKWAR